VRRRGRPMDHPHRGYSRIVRKAVCLVSTVVMLALAGCGGGDPLDNPALTATTTRGGRSDAAQWNAYSAEEKTEYRRAFTLCNGWADVNSPSFDQSGKKAADYVNSHQGTAAADGCSDGISGLPLAGSGIPVPH
jgi:hypothetical protein